jgi:hypothetical protein
LHDQFVALEYVEASRSLILEALGDLTISNEAESQPIRKLVVTTKQGKDLDWTLVDTHRNQTVSGKHLGDFSYHLTDSLVFHFSDQITSAFCLHAAAVEIDGRAIILVGQSGAGKSSLTAWLVAQGAKYITDELTVVTPDGLVMGLSRPIQIKAKGIGVVSSMLTQGRALEGQLVSGLSSKVLGSSCVNQGKKIPLGLIVFPQYSPYSMFAMNPLSSGEAGLEIMQSFVNARHLERFGFEALMKLVKVTPCCGLSYSSFDSFGTRMFTDYYL